MVANHLQMNKLEGVQKFFERIIRKGNDPSFLIIGVQKASTTTLFSYLNSHPKLAGSWPKEVHYFTRKMHTKDLNWYRKRFTSFKKDPLFFEASPNYIFFEDAAREIHKVYPSIKLILLLREPVDRAYSAWNMYNDFYNEGIIQKRLGDTKPNPAMLMFKNLVSYENGFPSFKQAAELEMELIAKGEPLGVNFLRKGLYYDQVTAYLKYFSREQLLIIGMKDLVKEPDKTVKQILTFLQVDGTNWQKPSLPVKNKRTYSAKLSDDDRAFVSRFFEEPNRKLKEFLGYQINW